MQGPGDHSDDRPAELWRRCRGCWRGVCVAWIPANGSGRLAGDGCHCCGVLPSPNRKTLKGVIRLSVMRDYVSVPGVHCMHVDSRMFECQSFALVSILWHHNVSHRGTPLLSTNGVAICRQGSSLVQSQHSCQAASSGGTSFGDKMCVKDSAKGYFVCSSRL